MDDKDSFTPRNYQVELMNICLERNTIIFLPTGAGKTYIALMVLKRMSGSLIKPYNQGGKVTIILVNTVALAEQHCKYIDDHANLRIAKYTGELLVDFWLKDKWLEEINKSQVLVMTSQIMLNIVNNNYIDLNKVNLIIFDECHRGVDDHSMRQMMKHFENLREAPRVIGLTATLLNGNCKPSKVMEEVRARETTFHSKVATVDGLDVVVGYSTNPTEKFKMYTDHALDSTEAWAYSLLGRAAEIVESITVKSTPLNIKGLKPLEPSVGYNRLKNLIVDAQVHVKMLGLYGATKVILAHVIQCERIRKQCQDLHFLYVLNYVLTTFTYVKAVLIGKMDAASGTEREKIFAFSSDKVLKLFEIFAEYKRDRSQVEVCCLVFTQRRFTARILHHVLAALADCDQEYGFIKSNFMVGYQNNPYNDTREGLFIKKKNQEALDSFASKEINVLVASNVLEEGVDIPTCTLVVKFDAPLDYRAYIQSKGRARHKDSVYYIMVERSESSKYMVRINEFQLIEKILINYLVGHNSEREDVSEEELRVMYGEDEIPPYYADGPGSARVDMLSAISLLCRYCCGLKADAYTQLAPEWYVRDRYDADGDGDGRQAKESSVAILLPTQCPITEVVEGPWMRSTKLAKRAAALKTCIALHRIGELDEHLLPRRSEQQVEEAGFLFSWEEDEVEETDGKEKTNKKTGGLGGRAGTAKMKRAHERMIPEQIRAPITSTRQCFVHVVNFTPEFQRQDSDVNNSTMYDLLASPLTFGLLTPEPLPTLCDFPLFVTLGSMTVRLETNRKTVTLTDDQLTNVRNFHFAIFNDVLQILQTFLTLDKDRPNESMLLVPVDKSSAEIRFNLLTSKALEVKRVEELTTEEKLGLEVTIDSHWKKIVSPWYRDPAAYVVTEVSLNKTARSPFPNDQFDSFCDYFESKHGQRIRNPDQPLLLVKGLTKRLNFVLPRGKEGKRKRDRLYEEMIEYLIPELVVKQEFPSSLWAQANLMPTVLYRVAALLRAESLRVWIARETGMGGLVATEGKGLELDEYLIDCERSDDKKIEDDEDAKDEDDEDMDDGEAVDEELPEDVEDVSTNPNAFRYNKDYAAKVLEAEFPWKDVEEPKDIERDLNVNATDIEYFQQFISCSVKETDRKVTYSFNPTNNNRLAIKYHSEFKERPIKLLDLKCRSKHGPELRNVYRALTTAKANEIVNLERLETLGDSFLKYITSVYISIRFPKYNEGNATVLKSRLVSNKNLYYLAVKKKLAGFVNFMQLSAKDEWLPPGFTVPEAMSKRIANKEVSINSLFDLNLSVEEQKTGELSEESVRQIEVEEYPLDEREADCYKSMGPFLNLQSIGDKYVADCVESLIGLYLESNGLEGGLRMVEWLKIIPASERVLELLKSKPLDPVLNKNMPRSLEDSIKIHLPNVEGIETVLGYKFRNRAFLLQALTHPSYTPNRVTGSYERLEFIGDAVLDFLVTCCIYESCGMMDPGHLTDLRSALVNNNTFASFLVRIGLHKDILMISSVLQGFVDKFVEFLKRKNYEIDDQVLVLMEEEELTLAEYVDVPKILGDVFEALAGAVFLDSGYDLKTVWKVFYKIMYKEIELFSQNVPKNVVRRLFEYPKIYPKFRNTIQTANNKYIICLQFMLNGEKKYVHGCGMNKGMAKKAAAKLALRALMLNKRKS